MPKAEVCIKTRSPQPHVHSKARKQSPQLENGLLADLGCMSHEPSLMVLPVPLTKKYFILSVVLVIRKYHLQLALLFFTEYSEVHTRVLSLFITFFPVVVDMELKLSFSGLYQAAHDLKIEWGVIKGVSDFANGRKSNTDSWRPFASVMAASLTAHILDDPDIFKDWKNFESRY